MSQERQQDLQTQIEVAAKIRDMTKTEGWRQIVRPALEARRNDAFKRLVEEPEIDNIRAFQADVRALTYVLGIVDTLIQNGRQAEHELSGAAQTDDS